MGMHNTNPVRALNKEDQKSTKSLTHITLHGPPYPTSQPCLPPIKFSCILDLLRQECIVRSVCRLWRGVLFLHCLGLYELDGLVCLIRTCSKTVLRRRVLCAVYISTLKTSIKSRDYDISIVMHMLLLLLLLSSILNSFFQDLPSFVRYLQQFSRDLRYYLIRNKSVPAGSVKLS